MMKSMPKQKPSASAGSAAARSSNSLILQSVASPTPMSLCGNQCVLSQVMRYSSRYLYTPAA